MLLSVVALFARARERNYSAVYLAIRDAVRSARAEAGFAGPFRLDSPATAERIRMSCPDEITRRYSLMYIFCMLHFRLLHMAYCLELSVISGDPSTYIANLST